MRHFWLLLAAVWLVGAWQAHAQEPPVSAIAPLPEGDTGIAAKYPGDVGIEKDSAVVLYDGFEECATPADLHKKWEMVIHEANIRIAEEPANVNRGKRAVEFTVPKQREGLAIGMHDRLKEEREVLFLRFYSKYEKDFDQRGSCHSGGTISAHYQIGHVSTPGIPADGRNKFLANFETERGRAQSPGPLNIYCYHPEQGGPFGDHIYSSGKVTPSGRRLASAAQPLSFGPQFVARPEFIPELDRWYCYEFMVKANTVGRRDGRIACWVDGKLIADFPNLRLRDVDTLKIDWFGIGLYMNPNTIRANKKWFDDVVAATSYIGPIVDAAKTPTKP